MKSSIICFKLVRTPFVLNLGMFLLFLIIGGSNVSAQKSNWNAPSSSDRIKNPIEGKINETAAGKKLYKQFCSICHGTKGKGDGVAGMALKPRPANFVKSSLQNQTDGAIYWKLTEGKSPMASYKEVLTEKQRWQLVNYIRTFRK